MPSASGRSFYQNRLDAIVRVEQSRNMWHAWPIKLVIQSIGANEMTIGSAKIRAIPQQAQTDWLNAIERAMMAAEAAELELSRQGGDDPSQQRKASGSYYTPSDVAAHFWDLFFRHHRINDLSSLLAFSASTDFVEPSAGSGMFVFSFLRKAAMLGATPQSLSGVRFHVIDVNLAALRFFSETLRGIESATGARFEGIGPSQSNFLEWVEQSTLSSVVFIGNPPFVTNARGDRWRNLYANFVEAMLAYPGTKGMGLILPLSVCFSRDYAELRTIIRAAKLGISASSYDNIPDCLFKAGKPDSLNTNGANSQRCTILNLGGVDPTVREASPLLNWSSADRTTVLSTIPTFRPFNDEDSSGQFPRPASDFLAKYMCDLQNAQPLGIYLSKISRPAFAVGGVARNYIGIRDFDPSSTGVIPIKPRCERSRRLLLQVFSSKLFFDYWRTFGDGFHVTVDMIERFPVTTYLENRLLRRESIADSIWENRAVYAKEKLNSGKIIRSYDFRGAFGI